MRLLRRKILPFPKVNEISQTSTPAPVIVITVDGLNTFMLGLYGNTTLETPAFDRIAADGITFDFAFAHSTDLRTSIGKMLTRNGSDHVTHCFDGRTTMVTDCPQVADGAQGAQFETIIRLGGDDSDSAGVDSGGEQQTAEPAETIAQTRAAEFFTAGIEAVEQLDSDGLLWLHFSGLSQIWDAPAKMRFQFADAEDPDPYLETVPPRGPFDAEVDDPDQLVSIQHALTAQVSLVDQLLGMFLDFVDQHPVAKEAHLILSSPRGYSLGGGGTIGVGDSLESESVHVPLLVLNASGRDGLPTAGALSTLAGSRSYALVQNSLLLAVVEHLVGDGDVPAAQFLEQQCPVIMPESSKALLMSNDRQSAIQNRQWKLVIEQSADQGPNHRLYVKPDDRWDVNDVSARCPRVVDELTAVLTSAIKASGECSDDLWGESSA